MFKYSCIFTFEGNINDINIYEIHFIKNNNTSFLNTVHAVKKPVCLQNNWILLVCTTVVFPHPMKVIMKERGKIVCSLDPKSIRGRG